MYGHNSYDYDALAWQPPSEEPDPYFIATPCRAILHAAHVESRSASRPLAAPAAAVSRLQRVLRVGRRR